MKKVLPALVAGLLMAAVSAQSQVRSAYPSFQSALPVSDAMLASLDGSAPSTMRLPFETPASIACIYRLVANIVPGCPTLGTHDLPAGGSGMIVIINAYDHPAVQHDLNIFSHLFGLPACDESNPCFQKVYATGTQPPLDALWAINAADVTEYAHAFAPAAQIVLVEAASGSHADLDFAVTFANEYVNTNSPTGTAQMILPWGDFESADELSTDALFTTPGIVYISGNQFGLDLQYPASSPNVIGVGVSGILREGNGMFVAEYASQFDTGGMSAFEPRPPYQDAIAGIVGGGRGVPDVALISDPLRGAVMYYDSVPLDGFVGWQFSGNVGIAEAIWAAIINHAGRNRPSSVAELTAMYGDLGNARAFRDITVGQAYGNHAAPGWDVLSGLGTDLGYLAK